MLVLEIPQHDPAEHDHVAVTEVGLLDATAVDERAVGAAVIEDPRPRGPRHDDRVPPRYRGLVEAQVGREAAPDVDHLAGQRYEQGLIPSFDLDVAARLDRIDRSRPVADGVVEARDRVASLCLLLVDWADEGLGAHLARKHQSGHSYLKLF